MEKSEAIAHTREVASTKYAEGMLCHANPSDEELDGCIECAREHEQLAEWLSELQQYQQIGTLEDIQRAMGNPISSLQELFQYRKIGTLKECEEARRKRETMMIFRNVAGWYNCPECGNQISITQKYCDKCGQSVKCIKEGWERYEI